MARTFENQKVSLLLKRGVMSHKVKGAKVDLATFCAGQSADNLPSAPDPTRE
jgi:hypothetical protein